MKFARLIAPLLLILSASSPLPAQDLDAFDFDDFLDPELLKIDIGGKSTSAGFIATYIHLGYVSNYQNRSTFTKESPRFVRLANSFSYKNFQASVKAVNLEEGNNKGLFSNKFTLEADYYYKFSLIVNKSTEVPYSNRVRISWDQFRKEKGETSSAVSLGLDSTAETLAPGLMVRYEYTWVNASKSDNGSNRNYFSLNSRSPIQAFQNGSKILAGLGVGVERTLQHIRWGAIRTEFAFESPLYAHASKVRLTYAPSYQLDQGRFNQELSIILNPPTFTKLFGVHRKVD